MSTPSNPLLYPCAAELDPAAAKHAMPVVAEHTGDHGASSASVHADVDALDECEATLFARALTCNDGY